MPLSITRPRIPCFHAHNPSFGEKIFSIPRIISEKPSLRRACRSQSVSINPAFMTQKHIASIDNHVSTNRPLDSFSPFQHAKCPTRPSLSSPSAGNEPASPCLLPALGSTRISNKTHLNWKKIIPFPTKISHKNFQFPRRPSVPALNVGGQCRRSVSAVSVYATYATSATHRAART